MLPRAETLRKLIENEEAAFSRTLAQGRQVFQDLAAGLKSKKQDVIPGAEAFKLWDTFGFPVELTTELAQSLQMTVDKMGFDKAYDDAIQISQAGSSMDKNIFATGPVEEIKSKFAGKKTVFEGYSNTLLRDAKVLAIVQDQNFVNEAHRGAALVLFDRTPFYGESGGQVGDRGTMFDRNVTGSKSLTQTLQVDANVLDTQKVEGLFLHRVNVKSGVPRWRFVYARSRRAASLADTEESLGNASAASRAAFHSGNTRGTARLAGRARPAAIRFHSF